MALLVLMSFAQPALAQGQAGSVGGVVTGATTEAAGPPVASAVLASARGEQVYLQDCYYYEYEYCYPDGDRGRGRGDHGRGRGGGGGGGGRGGRR